MNAIARDPLSAPWIASDSGAGQPLAVTHLALPRVDNGVRYAWYGLGVALAGRLGSHALRPQRLGRYVAQFRLSESLRQQWHRFFEHSGRRTVDAPCAFLYSHSAIRLVHARLLADAGADARHLLHLRHQTWHPLGSAAHAEAQTQRLDTRLKRAARVGHAAVLLVVETEVTDGAGRAVARVEDSYVARQLESADAMQFEDDAVLRRAIARLRRRVAELDEQESGVRCMRWCIDADAVLAFGAIAGGTSRLPGSRLCAKLLGGGRLPVQGAHLRNLVARELSRWGLDATRLSITFVGRAHAGQTLRLLQLDERFEVCDEAGHLVAFGKT